MKLAEYLRTRNPDPDVLRRIDFAEAADAVERFRDFTEDIIEVAEDHGGRYTDAAHRAQGDRRLPFDHFYFRDVELEAVSPLTPVLRGDGGKSRGVSSSRRRHVRNRDGQECRICGWTELTPEEMLVEGGGGWYEVVRPRSVLWDRDPMKGRWRSDRYPRNVIEKVQGRSEALRLAEEALSEAWERSAPDFALNIDHVIPRSLGGTKEPWNLWPLCSRCNQRKHRRLDPDGFGLAVDRLMRIATRLARSVD